MINKKGSYMSIKIIILSMAICFASFVKISASSEKDTIDIYWTDLGIGQWDSSMRIGDDFSKLDASQKETIVVRESKGQILIPMPSDKQLPKTDEEWQKLSSEIYETIKTKTNNALSSGITEVEIRAIQNINKPGYVAPWRQDKVVKFIEAFGLALEKFKGGMASDRKVVVNGIWGSNGGYAASLVVPVLKHKPIDKGILIDARAWDRDVKKLYHVMNGNLAVINTAGDVPATEGMVAHHETSKALKQALPNLKVYWVDSKRGINVFSAVYHLGSMHWEKSFAVKEFTGSKYVKLGEMTGGDLRNQILIKENKIKEGGVLIDPKPVKVGNSGSETKKKVINSKPSDNTLYWDYK